MATAKTGIKRDKAGVQSDTNIKQLTMGNGWRTAAMRKATASRGGSAGKAKTKVQYPPAEGWTAENTKKF